MYCIITCDHLTACADNNDKAADIYREAHNERGLDTCDDYDDYYYTEREVLEALGHSDLTQGDVL
jgi:hypothetical protein